MSKINWGKAPVGATVYADGKFWRLGKHDIFCFIEGSWVEQNVMPEAFSILGKYKDYQPRHNESVDAIAYQNAPERTTGDLSAKPVSKYHRTIKGVQVDLYDVLVAYGVTCPALAHGIKKATLPGQRHAKTFEQDIDEAIASLQRAKELAAGPTTN